MAAFDFSSYAAFVWSVADLLHGDYKRSHYRKVILPFTVLRRLDCVLEATKSAYEKRKTLGAAAPFLTAKSGFSFCNTSPMDFAALQGDSAHIKPNLLRYVNAFSENVRDIFDASTSRRRSKNLTAPTCIFRRCRSSPPGHSFERGHGPDVRGTDPPLRRTLQRNSRRTLHAAGSNPADGQPALRCRPMRY